jgi:hypothetical protein
MLFHGITSIALSILLSGILTQEFIQPVRKGLLPIMSFDTLPSVLAVSCHNLAEELHTLLPQNPFSLTLYGSAVLGDFRAGWSDIDILCLTDHSLDGETAQTLVTLRQQLVQKHNEPLYRSFEGAILSRDAFLSGSQDRVVYWGTGGERLRDDYPFDPFSMLILKQHGLVLAGEDTRYFLPTPTQAELTAAVAHHCDTIRKYAITTRDHYYSAGWMLDIARGLYTLRTGGVTSKTAAARWALEHGLAPDAAKLRKVLDLRQDPSMWKQEGYDRQWLAELGPEIQRFADVLERELKLVVSNMN